MAREEAVTCDLPSCRKTAIGTNHDHIQLNIQHVLAQKDVPDEFGSNMQTLGSGRYDFCSYEHMAEWLAAFSALADEERVKRVQDLDALKHSWANPAPSPPVFGDNGGGTTLPEVS